VRSRSIPLALTAASFALALIQRPGLASSDTKIDLHVDPAGFLSDVVSTWTPTGALGHVQGGQYGGYLFPMGPFFAAGHALGLAPWLVQRLWLGALLALAAWGTVRLLDELLDRERGIAHAVAGALVLLNPYVVVFSNRTSVTLLGYAALPWLLVAVHRGVRDPRRWWWPAAFALIVTATGGGVNAAVTAWVLLGPALLLVYEPALARVAWRDARAFALRAGAATLAASLWWLGPVLVQALYGIDFLEFTEQPGTIWGTTSVTESLRLMGYWVSYIGVGYGGHLRPYFNDAGVMLTQPLVLTATLLVPALALAGFWWTRRWRYGPFFLALTLGGLLVMAAGFPEGAPLRRALTFTYNRVDAVQFLRTTYKAAPLVALGIAALGGAAAAEAWRRLPRASAGRAVAFVALAGLVALSAWPLVRGRALDDQVLWERVPPAWQATANDLDASLPRNERAVVLPGQLFAFYRWGATIDPILPALTDRPVAVRSIVPYADLHAIDLLWTVDALVQERRALPGQLRPLLGLLGAGAAVAATDDARQRSGAPPPASAAEVLDGPAGLGVAPVAAYGLVRRFPPAAGELGPERALPQVRRYDLPASRGIVRVEPDSLRVVVDGSANALTGLAAFGALPDRAPILYAGDRSAAALRDDLRDGGELVISDSNRRRVFVASRLRQNAGATLAAGDPISEDAAVLDPFSDRGTDDQTVARLTGVAYLRAPFSPGFPQFPEHRPFAAFDSDPHTAWLADRNLDVLRRRLDVGFTAARDVPHVDVLPYSDPRGTVTAVAVGGLRYEVHAGWNRLPLGLRQVRRLRLRIAGVRQPVHASGGAGGFAEVRIPGVRVGEALRPPVVAERALAGRDLGSVGLTYLFERTTGDDPFARSPFAGPAQGALVRDRGDGESGLRRVFSPPAARSWRADAWVTVAAGTADHELDELAGALTAQRFDSSGRFEGRPGFRASRAFDGSSARGWVGQWAGGHPAWLDWTSPRPITIRRLVLDPIRERVRFPARVRLRWAGGSTGALEVGSNGAVWLPAPARARAFRLEILDAHFPPGTSGRDRQRRAVGIGELRMRGLRPVAIPRAVRRPERHGRRRTAAPASRGHGRRPRRRPPVARPRVRPRGVAPGRGAAAHLRARHLRAVPAAPARAGARPGRRGDWRRARPRPRQLRPRRPRRRARGAERPVVARPRRELQPRLARDLRRTFARRAAGHRRVRQRMAGPGRLPIGALRLRAESAGAVGLRALGARLPAAARAAGSPPLRTRRRRYPRADPGRRRRTPLAPPARGGPRPGRGRRARLRLRDPRRRRDCPGGHARALERNRHLGPARGRGRPARGGRPRPLPRVPGRGSGRLQHPVRGRPHRRALVRRGGLGAVVPGARTDGGGGSFERWALRRGARSGAPQGVC